MINQAEYLATCGTLQVSIEMIAQTAAVMVRDLLAEIERLKRFETLYNEACDSLAKLAYQKPTAYFNPAATSTLDAFRFPGSHVDTNFTEALYASPRPISHPKEALQ